MISLETWADAAGIVPLLEPDLRTALQAHLDRLTEFADYALDELARLVIVEPGDVVTELAINGAGVLLPVGADTFAIDPEYAAQHGDMIEVVWIISDDGYGVVLFVPATSRTSPELLHACQKALRETASR